MLTLARPAVIGFSLMVASHLGISGVASGQSDPPTSSIQQRSPVDLLDDDPTWRVDEAVGLAANFDPMLPPLKQTTPEHSSDPAPVPGPPAADLGQAIAQASVPEPSPANAPVIRTYEVEDNHYVRQFIDQFQTGYRRAVVEGWLARSGRYLPMILDVFRQKGLPDELVFTAMIESGFNPVAVSRAGAKGLWQFMAPTARRYGLRVDEWLDERLDPEKSTMAAARHLLDLYAVFGSWNLVQAAYNAGEMKVLQAIRAMGTSDFWTLRGSRILRDETKNYIPAIQAATVIARAPERYGFVVTPAEPLQYEVVAVPKGTSLRLLALESAIPFEALERLNPELRLKQTPPDGPYSLKVPVGGAKSVQLALDRNVVLRAPAASRATDQRRGKAPVVHVVRARETAKSIARRYNISVDDLFRWNGLDQAARIRPGDRLRVVATPGRPEGG
jgi:membrane-bound lytic murein transglycosylase D